MILPQKKSAYQLEVCVDTIDGLHAAFYGGADRIELCSALSEGGLTPSAGMIQAAAKLPIPCHAMIRPRAGGFRFSKSELQIMLHDIEIVHDARLAGVVVGAMDESGNLDQKMLRVLLAAAEGLDKTLHRVVDTLDDPIVAVDRAIDLGFCRILTSGGAETAYNGLQKISEMVKHAGGKIAIMPGSGITAFNIQEIRDRSLAKDFHASCRYWKNELNHSLFSETFQTSESKVSELKSLLLKKTNLQRGQISRLSKYS